MKGGIKSMANKKGSSKKKARKERLEASLINDF